MMKRMLNMLLALALVLSLAFVMGLSVGAAEAAATPIDKVVATIAEPVVGQPFPQPVISADVNYGMTATWYDGYTDEIATGNVRDGGIYYMEVEVKAAEGYVFAEDTVITLNAQKEMWNDYDDYTRLIFYAVYSFAQPIDKIEVFYELPEVGKAPGAVTVPQGANYSLKEEDTGWFYSGSYDKVTDIFEDGYRYDLEARVELMWGYELKLGVTEIYVNGEKRVYNGGGSNWLGTAITVYGESFSTAKAVEKVELPAWPELKVGDELPAITGETEYYEYYYRWEAQDAKGNYYGDAYTVEENMVYYVGIIVGPKAGYEFTEDTVLTVGGAPISDWGYVGYTSAADLKVYNFGAVQELDTVNLIASVPGIGQTGGAITVPAGAPYTIYNAEWVVASDATFEDEEEQKGAYKAGDRVGLLLDVEVKSGYIMKYGVTITLNGKEYPVVYRFGNPDYIYALLDLGEVKKGAEYNGLVEVNGVWGYYKDGVLQTDYTGLVPYGDILFYVEDGILDFSYTGLVWYKNAWTYVANSQLTEGYTGLVWFEGEWFYTVDSVIDWTFTGLVPYEGNMFYVQNNHLDWGYTGLAYLNDGWYYVESALLKPDYTGLTYFNDNWFYVVDGTIDWTFTGMVPYNGNYFYVQNNLLDWNHTGLGYHDGAWYYFQNALYTPSFTGLVPFEGSLFYVKGGTVDWTYNGTAEYDGVTYTVENGVAKK